jgi:hypothetical protein
LPIDTTQNLLTSLVTTRLGLQAAYGELNITAFSAAASHGAGGSSPRSELVALAPKEEAGQQSAPPLDKITLELPISVGNVAARLTAGLMVALAATAHDFEFREYDQHMEGIWIRAVVVGISVFVALVLGLKPQGGD